MEDISSARPHLHNTNERYTNVIDSRSIPTRPPGEYQYKHGPVCPGASVYRVTLNLFIVKIVTRLANDINAKLTRGFRTGNGKFYLAWPRDGNRGVNFPRVVARFSQFFFFFLFLREILFFTDDSILKLVELFPLFRS